MTNDKKVSDTNNNDIVQCIVNNGKKMANEEFPKFSAIMAVIFTCGLWIIKGFWYMYWSGKFFVYNIDKCYITTNSENVILQIMQLVSVLVVWFLSNYIYYKILTSKDTSKFSWKRKRNKLLFWSVEMIIMFLVVLYYNNISLIEEFKSITFLEIVVILLLLFFLCFMLNIYALQFEKFTYSENEETVKTESMQQSKKKRREKNNNKNMLQKMINLCCCLVVTIALEMVGVYSFAVIYEQARSDYKVVLGEAIGKEDSMFEFKVQNLEGSYKVYPIVHETSEYYIVCRLYSDIKNGSVEIDYDYQRILDKEGQESLYIDNVYMLGGDY